MLCHSCRLEQSWVWFWLWWSCRQAHVVNLQLSGITADISQRPAADALWSVLLSVVSRFTHLLPVHYICVYVCTISVSMCLCVQITFILFHTHVYVCVCLSCVLVYHHYFHSQSYFLYSRLTLIFSQILPAHSPPVRWTSFVDLLRSAVVVLVYLFY